jgi:polyisoprenoid-binding protein YceI
MRRVVPAISAVVALTLAAPAPGAAQSATWAIDPTHSELTFRIRHYVTKVRGTFAKWSGSITADPRNLGAGAVSVSIDSKSIDTNNENRDNHLTDSCPSLDFKSTHVMVKGDEVMVHGNLTIRGKTKPVTLTGSFGGVTKDMQGKERIGFEASTRINRLDYGVSWNRAIEGGGIMLGDEVEINITIEAVRS